MISIDEVLASLETLKQYCKQCTPNDSLEDCKNNCCLYKQFSEDQESCYILNMFEYENGEDRSYTEAFIYLKEVPSDNSDYRVWQIYDKGDLVSDDYRIGDTVLVSDTAECRHIYEVDSETVMITTEDHILGNINIYNQ